MADFNPVSNTQCFSPCPTQKPSVVTSGDQGKKDHKDNGNHYGHKKPWWEDIFFFF